MDKNTDAFTSDDLAAHGLRRKGAVVDLEPRGGSMARFGQTRTSIVAEDPC
jgi:hypothetical protein